MRLVLENAQEAYLAHHGILGQRWGQKNGPPYPLKGGDYSKSETEEIYEARKSKNSIYNKKHFDTVLKEGQKSVRYRIIKTELKILTCFML